MPNTMKLVRLDFGRSPTHFGKNGIGLESTDERVFSDTLFSAWVSTYARLFQETEDEKLPIERLFDKFSVEKQPPFRLSSTFVYRRQGDSFIDYLPMPVQRPLNYPSKPTQEMAISKAFKALHYLPLPIWQRWYQGIGFTDQDYESISENARDPENKLYELGEAGTFDYGSAFSSYELPKVAIDRTNRATNFHHTGLTQFGWQTAQESDDGTDQRAGLYFLADFSTAETALESKLKAALHLLGEEGIGGERSSGAGRFDVLSWEPAPSIWQQTIAFDSNRYSLISLYWEKSVPESLLGEDACYSLIERGGWIASPWSGRQLRRQKIHMFAEGSVFTARPHGQLANVTPSEFEISPGVYRPHPIYRSGIALSLAINAPSNSALPDSASSETA